MHAARLKTSERLQRVAALLKDGQWHSTLDIVRRANVCAVNSAVSELRRNGLNIICQSASGDFDRRIWCYRLLSVS